MNKIKHKEIDYIKIHAISHLINKVKTDEDFRILKDQLIRENISLQDEINSVNNFEEIIGSDNSLKEVLNKVKMVANTDTTVLIRGETGTGKELIARSLHDLSKRRDRPVIKVNCPAIPSGLLESELFGHEKGAFTGALTKKLGKFELADGGTIFLDELGDLPLDAQAKLLRVLQEQEFEHVGGNETINVNVRVIAATNINLEKSVKEGKFRADLYYRLNVFPINIPPLRNRVIDIPALSNYFLCKYSKKIGKEINNIEEETIEKLKKYSWPGNIRELENIIERAVILNQEDTLSIEENLNNAFDKINEGTNHTNSLEYVNKNHIINVLNQTGWRINGNNGAAKILGINPSTLRNRLTKLGIKKKTIQLN